MRVLVDGDIVAYRCAASVADEEPLEIALYRIDELMRQLLYNTQADIAHTWLSGNNNFRYQIYPEYKANRKEMKRPAHLAACKDFLTTEYGAIRPDIWEADDALGYNQSDDTIIASIDKDLLMVHGNHHNWVKSLDTYVAPFDGLKHFYKQMLIGDRSDNVVGIKGLGEKKSERMFANVETEQELFDQVYALYNDPKRFLINASVLWINQGENNQTWEMHLRNTDLTLPDELQPELDRISSFMKSLMDDTSTALGMNQTEIFGIPANGIGKDFMPQKNQDLT